MGKPPVVHLRNAEGQARCHWRRRGHTDVLDEVTCRRCLALAVVTDEAAPIRESETADLRELQALFGERLALFDDHRTWLEDRRAARFRIGGSDVAAILGVNPWRSPWDVWVRHHGEPEPVDAAKAADFERGRRWEDRVLDDYSVQTGRKLLSLPGPVIVSHETEGWLVGSPDGFARDAGELGGTEAKTDRFGDGWGDDGSVIERWGDDSAMLVPPHYALQVYTYLEVTGLPWWDIAVAVPQSFDFPKVSHVRIMADASIQAQVLDVVGRWREKHLVGGEPPPADGSDGCKRGLAQLYKGDPDKEVREATDAEAELVAELAHVKAQRKDLESREQELQNQLGELMGETYGVRLGEDGPKALWIPRKGRTLIDRDRLKSDFPEAYAACKKRGRGSRSFRLYGFDK